MPQLNKTFPTRMQYDANVWFIKSLQWENTTNIMDVTLFGFESAAKAAAGADPVDIKHERIVLSLNTQQTTILNMIAALPQWAGATVT